MESINLCWDCEEATENEVIVHSDLESHGCLECAISQDVSFSLPSGESSDEFYEYAKQNNLDPVETYNNLVHGE